MVLSELDKLKELKRDQSTAFFARQAIRFINDIIENSCTRIKCNCLLVYFLILVRIYCIINIIYNTTFLFLVQTAIEDAEHIVQIETPDDKIINSCLQLAKKGHRVIVVTHDKNLQNKLWANGIEVQKLENFLSLIPVQ